VDAIASIAYYRQRVAAVDSIAKTSSAIGDESFATPSQAYNYEKCGAVRDGLIEAAPIRWGSHWPIR